MISIDLSNYLQVGKDPLKGMCEALEDLNKLL